ncbi:yjeF N-terminal region [Dethiosulfatibacter aminovorans DSM 17477]|uniref:NAD(P)H-hydrate epimerase n=1 Tax=Dethiosulfatibacter aminovorans DSM 17477 TaxID=1121476 RepID=A0A1M6KTZ2_9FIRM|nr:NAD(P)H-hydrate epimerase [Dethiosulfatibacter aminovorans]SHJ62437.1 yjeF N-terminal region [Dethiosulfatibacter aminovorans DSM 17477]
MKIEILSADIRKIDRYCVEVLGIPEMILMESAALSVLKNIDTENITAITIVCGTGNNGGDGLALSRLLSAEGIETEIYIIGRIEKMSPACRKQYEILKNMDMEIRVIESPEDIGDLEISMGKSQMTVDSIFGIGLKRELNSLYSTVLDAINDKSGEIVSIDVPSGMNSDTGRILTNCVKANMTVSFIGRKKGFANMEEYTGKVIVENIGVSDITVKKALGSI